MRNVAVLAVIAGLCSYALAQQNAGWRTDGTGYYEQTRPPVEWSHEKNVIWATEMPSRSNSTPIIVGDKIFVNSEQTDLLCVSLIDGSILWKTSHTYFDTMTPEEAEKGRELQRAAQEMRARIKPLDDERGKLDGQLKAIRDLRSTVNNLESELELHDNEVLAGRIEEITAQAEDTAKRLADAPNNRNLQRQSERLTNQLTLLKDPEALARRLEEAKKELAAATEKLEIEEKEEENLTNRIAALRKEADDLRREELAPLTIYDLPSTHGTNGYSTCTPVSDGQHVWTLFGNGVLSCHDLDGNRIWMKFIEKPRAGWGHSTSPVIAGNMLIVQLNTLRGFNRETGEEVWQNRQIQPAWGSLITTRIGDADVVITPRGEIVHAEDGNTMARGLSRLEYAAPIVQDGVAWFVEKNGRAIKLPESTEGKPETLWTFSSIEGDRYYASAVYSNGIVYGINQRGRLTAIDAETGEVVYEQAVNLGGTIYTSITAAGDKIYISSDNGRTVVIEAGREYKEISRNALDSFRSNPVFHGNRMYIRSMKYLYCIGE